MGEPRGISRYAHQFYSRDRAGVNLDQNLDRARHRAGQIRHFQLFPAPRRDLGLKDVRGVAGDTVERQTFAPVEVIAEVAASRICESAMDGVVELLVMLCVESPFDLFHRASSGGSCSPPPACDCASAPSRCLRR